MALDTVYAPQLHREIASTSRLYKISINIKRPMKRWNSPVVYWEVAALVLPWNDSSLITNVTNIHETIREDRELPLKPSHRLWLAGLAR